MFNESNNVRVAVDKNIKNLPDPSEVNCNKKSLLIFNDIMLGKKQTTAESFFIRGSHNNCSCIYKSQNYHKRPRKTIRTNANVFVLFSQNKKDLQHIYGDCRF